MIEPLNLKKIYEVDYIGMETFQVTQNLVLAGRSVEQFNKYDNLAKLSARGLHHRDRRHFEDHLKHSTNSIDQARRQGAYDIKSLKSSPVLIATYFRRAIANERLGHLDSAISDYSLVISVEPKHDKSLFNRSGLYMTKGKIDLALKDVDEAIRLDPTNSTYLKNRALMLRKRGNYMPAIHDTVLCRALELQGPEIIKDIKAGREPRINMATVSKFEKEVDPLITCLKKDKSQRSETDMYVLVDFLKSLKFFENISDKDVLLDISNKVELKTFQKGDVVFNEGDPGEHFYMIVDGEVSIVKLIKNDVGDFMELVLVKLFRGHAFGDTALETKGGLRSAGAKASNFSHLLALHADDYQKIMLSYREHLQKEVVDVLKTNEIFKTFEDNEAIKNIAKIAAVKHFNANMEIVKAGEKVKHLYIIKRGLLRMLKHTARPSMDTTNLAQFDRPDGALGKEAPGTWVLEKNWKDSIEDSDESDRLAKLGLADDRVDFVVGILGSGQVFGELSILDPTISSPVSVITSTQVEVYCFSSEKLMELGVRFNSNLMNKLNESLNVHNPTQEKIAYYFRSKVNWEQNKLKLLKTIRMEREARENMGK
jgi:CRP-like cAMP-binding protein